MEAAVNMHEVDGIEPDLNRFLLFMLNNGKYAIDISHVKELLLMPQCTNLPEAPHYSRGVINLRGSVIPCSDTRKRFGMEGLADVQRRDLQMMKQREQEHLSWINELEACVEEGRRFGLQRDPTKCAFGKWFHAYIEKEHLTYDVLTFLKEFQEPHRRIHAVADQVDDLMAKGDVDGAKAVIAATREDELKQMVQLFAEYHKRRAGFDREIAIVLEYNGKPHAITADALESVDELKRVEPAPAGTGSRIIEEIGHLKKGDETALIVHPQVFMR